LEIKIEYGGELVYDFGGGAALEGPDHDLDPLQQR
jgi:hypothetical protein